MTPQPEQKTAVDPQRQLELRVSPPEKLTAKEIFNYALVKIAIKSTCDCWEIHGIGSNIPPKWIGCSAHNSDDPHEYCFTCIANAALLNAAKIEQAG